MISERMERLKTRAKKAFAAIRAKIAAALHEFTPLPSAAPDLNALLIVASDGNVLDTGKRYRKTSGHAPLFSLFTFFANR
jgi:hypothetical protein